MGTIARIREQHDMSRSGGIRGRLRIHTWNFFSSPLWNPYTFTMTDNEDLEIIMADKDTLRKRRIALSVSYINNQMH
jgi:hypothetical protein